MYFDTHAHYSDSAFDEDREELLASLPARGVSLVLEAGCDLADSARAIALAQRYAHVYAAVGIHPEELKGFRPEQLESLRTLAAQEKCVAIGEIGLDYYWDASQKEAQRELFRRQLELALEMGKPVIVHDREAHGDCLETVSLYPELRGVFHCFSGSPETAAELLRRGWYLGFDGPVTYKNARRALEVLELCPMDRLLLETDCPYLSPVPLRGKRNDSSNLPYIAEAVGRIKGCSAGEAAEAAFKNGLRLFGIDAPAAVEP